jgi:hypothetical protein
MVVGWWSAGYWMALVIDWCLVAGGLYLVVGEWLLVLGNSCLVVGFLLFVVDLRLGLGV